MPTRSKTPPGYPGVPGPAGVAAAPRPRQEIAEAPPIAFEEIREQALLQRSREGDRAALEELLLLMEPRINALCFRMAGRAEDARDLCQEAMVKIIRGLPGFSGRSRFSTWATRIAMNVCLTSRRRGKLRKTASLDAPARGAPEHEPLAERCESREPPADERVQRGEELKNLAQALARLEPEQRALLILRDCQGLDYAEIADVIEAPVGTVKSRLFRARAALRELMENRSR